MKQWKGFITGILATLLVLGLGGAAFAAVAQKQAALDYNDIKITLNGSAVTPTDANGAAVEPSPLTAPPICPFAPSQTRSALASNGTAPQRPLSSPAKEPPLQPRPLIPERTAARTPPRLERRRASAWNPILTANTV